MTSFVRPLVRYPNLESFPSESLMFRTAWKHNSIGSGLNSTQIVPCSVRKIRGRIALWKCLWRHPRQGRENFATGTSPQGLGWAIYTKKGRWSIPTRVSLKPSYTPPRSFGGIPQRRSVDPGHTEQLRPSRELKDLQKDSCKDPQELDHRFSVSPKDKPDNTLSLGQPNVCRSHFNNFLQVLVLYELIYF